VGEIAVGTYTLRGNMLRVFDTNGRLLGTRFLRNENQEAEAQVLFEKIWSHWL
jgi:hypothetical protein